MVTTCSHLHGRLYGYSLPELVHPTLTSIPRSTGVVTHDYTTMARVGATTAPRIASFLTRRAQSTVRRSIDDPPTAPPVARTAPSTAAQHEDVGVGQSELLLDTTEKVSSKCSLWLTTGSVHPRLDLHRWSWHSRSHRKGSSNAQDESIPGDSRRIRNSSGHSPQGCSLRGGCKLWGSVPLHNGLDGG